MKTRAIIKKLAIMALSAAMLVSCGKENKSSSNGSSSSSGGSYGYPGGTSYGNGSQLPSNWVDILINENPCINYDTGATSNARERMVVELAQFGVNVNAGAMFAGITAEGDVAVVSNKSGRPVAEIFACRRPDLRRGDQVIVYSQNGMPPVFNTSSNCGVGEITALNAGIMTRSAAYDLAFYPIYLDSINKPQYGSSLCQY